MVEIDTSQIQTEKQRNKRRNLKAEWREAKVKYVRDHLSEIDILLQAAEEASEFSQALVKYARFLRGQNPVDAKWDDERLRDAICEEFGDILVAIQPLDCVMTNDEAMDAKLDRWVDRLATHKKEQADHLTEMLVYAAEAKLDPNWPHHNEQ